MFMQTCLSHVTVISYISNPSNHSSPPFRRSSSHPVIRNSGFGHGRKTFKLSMPLERMPVEEILVMRGCHVMSGFHVMSGHVNLNRSPPRTTGDQFKRKPPQTKGDHFRKKAPRTKGDQFREKAP